MSPSSYWRTDDLDRWVDAFWAAGLAVCLVFTGYRLLGSAAWQRVLEFTPGGRVTIVIAIVTAAAAMFIAAARRSAWALAPWALGSVWCFGVALFQLYSALTDPTGPLGFWAWGYVSWQLLKHGMGQIEYRQ